jgi:hypothetical protein
VSEVYIQIALDEEGEAPPGWREEAVRWLRGIADQIEAADGAAVEARVSWPGRPGSLWRPRHPWPGTEAAQAAAQASWEGRVTPEEVMDRLDHGADPELRKLVEARAEAWGVSRLEALARLLGGAIEETRRIGRPPYIRIGDVEVGR